MKSIVCLKYQREENEYTLSPSDQAAVAIGNGGDSMQMEFPPSSITALAMGPPALEREMAYLRGYGVDRPVLLTDPLLAGADTYATACALKRAIEVLGEFDVVYCGRRGAGGETGQVPSELAALFGIPCITNVLHVTKEEGGLLCERLLETGIQTLRAPLPAVISLCEYSYTLRKPKLSLLRKAKGKKVEVLTCADLQLAREDCGLRISKTTVLRTREHEHRRKAKEVTCEEALELFKEAGK